MPKKQAEESAPVITKVHVDALEGIVLLVIQSDEGCGYRFQMTAADAKVLAENINDARLKAECQIIMEKDNNGEIN